MNIGLFGYGKMGREIESVAKSRSHSVVAIADIDSELDSKRAEFSEADVVIDFSVPAAVIEHINFSAGLKRPIVIGTTGWQNEVEKAKLIVAESGIAAVVASNFSLGVNLFISTVEKASGLFGRHEGFDCAVLESHHNQKVDAPSGTAMTIGRTILENFPSKKRIYTGIPIGKIPPEDLQIDSVRVGKEVGTHSVIFDSEFDHVELTHTSRGRRGFAFGAVMTAEWVIGKKGFYEFRDILDDL